MNMNNEIESIVEEVVDKKDEITIDLKENTSIVFSKEKKSKEKKSNEVSSVVSKEATEKTKVKVSEKEKEKNKKKKWYQKFKIPKALTIIVGILLICIFLTWIIPHEGYFKVEDSSGNIIHQQYSELYPDGIQPGDINWFDSTPFGLNFVSDYWYMPGGGMDPRYGFFDTIEVIIAGFLGAAGVIFFVFAIGAFIEVMMSSGTLEKGVGALENKLKGKEIILIPILFTLFALGGTTYGMQEETIGFFPIIIPFLLIAGFDSMTGFLVIVMGSTTGIAASTVNPFSVTVYADAMANSGADYVTTASSSMGMGGRFAIFALFTIIGGSIITFYAARVKKDKSHSLLADQYEDDLKWARDQYGGIDEHAEYKKMSKRQVIAIWIFGGTFLLMVIGMMPWGDWFGFDSSTAPDGFAIFSSLFFGSAMIGTWYYIQLIFLFLIMTIILGIIFKMNGKDISKTMIRGAKFMLSVAIIIGVARAISYVLIYSGLADTIVVSLLSSIGDVSPIAFSIIVFPIFLILGAFITSTSGLASAVGGIMGTFISGIAVNSSDPQATADALIIGTMLAYTLATGIMNMWSPTNGLLLAQAEAGHLDYPKVFKPLFSYAILITILSFLVIPGVTALSM
ncbi:MAG: transporter [Candidatus Hepatoplasma vulgare]|nr:MAG: transporter [Candidatus Hepatoplasma sp.]